MATFDGPYSNQYWNISWSFRNKHVDEELTYCSMAASDLQTSHSHSYSLACTQQISRPGCFTSVNGCLLGHQGIDYFVILGSGYRDA